MIVAIALKEIFKGLTVNGESVQYHFGDQKELLKWTIANYSRQKYPLIWYVINDVEDITNDGLRVDTQLIIFNLTKGEYFNTDRYKNVYLKWIQPTYEAVNNILNKNQFLNVLNNGKKLPYKDEPNFGVDNDDNDFTKKKPKGEQGINIDIVDARIMRLKMDIYPKCIIK